MNKKIKKFISIITIITILLIPMTAFASSYNFVYQFKIKLESSNYSMSGSNVTVNTKHIQHWGGTPTSSLFTVKLYRYHPWYDGGSDYIGSALYWRYYDDTATWTNVGSGTYYFVMEKSDDSEYLQGNGTITN